MSKFERPVDLELLSAYLDGEVTDEERAQVETHLAVSPAWRDELDSLRWTVSLLRDLPDMPLPRSFELPVPATKPLPVIQRNEPRAKPTLWGLDLGWMYTFLRSSAAVTVALLLAVVGLDAYQTQSVMREVAMPASAPATQAFKSEAQQAAAPVPPQAPSAGATELPKAAMAPAPAAKAAAPTTAPAAAPKAVQDPLRQPTFPAQGATGSDRQGGGAGGAGGVGAGGGSGGGPGEPGASDKGLAFVGTPESAAGAVGSSENSDTKSAMAPLSQVVPPAANERSNGATANSAEPPQIGPATEVMPYQAAARPSWRWAQVVLGLLAVVLAVAAWLVRQRLKTPVE